MHFIYLTIIINHRIISVHYSDSPCASYTSQSSPIIISNTSSSPWQSMHFIYLLLLINHHTSSYFGKHIPFLRTVKTTEGSFLTLGPLWAWIQLLSESLCFCLCSSWKSRTWRTADMIPSVTCRSKKKKWWMTEKIYICWIENGGLK